MYLLPPSQAKKRKVAEVDDSDVVEINGDDENGEEVKKEKKGGNNSR